MKDGFLRPEAKGGLGWKDADTVYVYTDFGPGSMTPSGYPRIVKEWKRGTPMSAASVVYEGSNEDMYIAAYHDNTPGFERDFVSRTIAFYNDELYLRGSDGKLVKIDVPNSTGKGVIREWLALELREPWEVDGRTYKAGSLLVAKFDDFMAGKRDFEVLFEPTDSTSLAGTTWTKNHVVLNVLDDVKNKLTVLTPSSEGWKKSAFAGAPALGTIGVGAVDSDDSDAVWMTVTDYLTPTTLMLAEVGQGRQRRSAEDHARVLRWFEGRGRAALRHLQGRHQGALLPGAAEGPEVRRQRADPAVRLRRLRDLADPGLFRRRRHGLAGERRRLRGGQHPRRRRVRPALAPGGAEAEPAQGLRGLRRGGAGPGRAQDHLAPSTSASRAAAMAAC